MCPPHHRRDHAMAPKPVSSRKHVIPSARGTSQRRDSCDVYRAALVRRQKRHGRRYRRCQRDAYYRVRIASAIPRNDVLRRLLRGRGRGDCANRRRRRCRGRRRDDRTAAMSSMRRRSPPSHGCDHPAHERRGDREATNQILYLAATRHRALEVHAAGAKIKRGSDRDVPLSTRGRAGSCLERDAHAEPRRECFPLLRDRPPPAR